MLPQPTIIVATSGGEPLAVTVMERCLLYMTPTQAATMIVEYQRDIDRVEQVHQKLRDQLVRVREEVL